MKDGYYYLAAPYSVGDTTTEEDRERRYWQITAMAAELMKANINTFSPITHSHPFVAFGLIKGHEWWLDLDLAYLRDAMGVFVLQLEGWQRSPGVKFEIEYAKENNIPIFYVAPDARVINKALEVGGQTNADQ